MNINWNIEYVYFNAEEPSIAFKFADEYIPLGDLKFVLEELLPYDDNWKIMKFEYSPPSSNNEENIKFNMFELKTATDVMAMWNTFFCYNFLSS